VKSRLSFVLVSAVFLLAAFSPLSAEPEPRKSVTEHRVNIDGQTVRYTATAGTKHLKNDAGEAVAEVFYVAYTRDRVRDPEERPVLFSFNGGPGSSAVWLHLGTFGPKRIQFEDAEQPTPPPHEFVDNAYSILDKTDLVFIDPVGTGYSRVVGEGNTEDFWGVEQDIESMSEFIRLWITRNDRWDSPKFLAGESYGTTRVAGLVDRLQNNEGMFFNGVALVSSILNFQTARFETGNDLPYVLFLPTYAATAWYHEALENRPEELEPFLDEVRDFAENEYVSALMKGSRLDEDERREIAERLSEYTGLDADYIERANLRIGMGRFNKELLRDEGKTVGRLDSRYLGRDRDDAGESYEYDPSYSAILGPYTSAMNHFLHRELEYEEDRKYEILSGNVIGNWDWEVTGRTGYVNMAENLRRAMSQNPHLKVLVANGYYDLATPFYASEYTFDTMQLDDDIRENNVDFTYYPAGHMMYIHPPSLRQLRDDMVEFIEGAL